MGMEMGMEMDTPDVEDRLSSEKRADETSLLHESRLEADELGEVDKVDEGRGQWWWHVAYVVIASSALISVRRALRDGFPYPICLLAVVQAVAYALSIVVTTFAKMRQLSRARRKSIPCERQRRSAGEWMREAMRFVLLSQLSAAAMICAMGATALFPNLQVLAMLPICTYVIDDVFRQCVSLTRFRGVHRKPTLGGIVRILFATLCIFAVIQQDYRLSRASLLFALASYLFASLGKAISSPGSEPESHKIHASKGGTGSYLLSALPPLLITLYAAFKLEDTTTAIQLARDWSLPEKLFNLAPAVLLQMIFQTPVSSAYPLQSDGAEGPLEGSSPRAKSAIALTLHTGLSILCVGGHNETNLINWIQILALTLLYIICVGPKQIAHYPPKLLNFLSKYVRRKPLPSHSDRWQRPRVILTTNLIFALFFSSSIIYWGDTARFNRDLSNWGGPSTPIIDNEFHPPSTPRIEIVIAHSANDSVASISDLIHALLALHELEWHQPSIKVYSKDQSLASADLTSLTGSYEGALTSTILPDIGGITATYLHHILSAWDSLTVQTLFVTTTDSTLTLPSTTARLRSYLTGPGLPLPDALPKTGFLNLGAHSVCSCTSCHDASGWNDSFHLIPSMFSASRPGAAPEACRSVLLTHGHNFLASARRIRGVKRDVWDTLAGALGNVDVRNSWAHDAARMPGGGTRRGGSRGLGFDGPLGVPFVQDDSLARPWLGLTVERLWGVLLGCSTPEVAWRCPGVERAWRVGGEKGDCACLD